MSNHQITKILDGVPMMIGEKGETMKKHYEVIRAGDEYTIGEYDAGYKAYIVNDGICGYYWWSTAEEAQKAADAYNAYEGLEWLGQHGYGNDRISADEIEGLSLDSAMVELYRLFGALDD